jgi:hypothetical protein
LANPFFDQPILNPPYDSPLRYWELDENGQPTQDIIEKRRPAEFITPIPKPKQRKSSVKQSEIGHCQTKIIGLFFLAEWLKDIASLCTVRG